MTGVLRYFTVITQHIPDTPPNTYVLKQSLRENTIVVNHALHSPIPDGKKNRKMIKKKKLMCL